MSAQRRPLESGRIVLVEDDENVRRSLTLLLRARGFAVDVYRSAEELLTNRTLPQADCFLIDYKMPTMNGLDLIARLRELGAVAPALMITGFFSNTLKARAEAAGFADVIEKPPEGSTLVDRLAAVMAA